MASLPISGLPNITGATDTALIPIVVGGVTYNVNIKDLWKSIPFATIYQSLIPDVTDTYSLGSTGKTFSSIHVGVGTVFIGQYGSLGIDTDGFVYIPVGVATNTVVLGQITTSGITSTGMTISTLNNELYSVSANGNQHIITQELVPTGGTTNQVLTKTSNTPTGYTWQNLYSNGASLRNFGVFVDTTTQTGSTNSVQAMKFNTTEHSSGVTVNNTTQITMASEGFYNIQFSAQLDKTSNGTDDVSIWFRRNGDNIDNSNTVITVTKQAGGNGRNVAAWNYVDYFTAGQYLEIMWSSSDSTTRILAQGTLSTPTRPSTPSTIVTVTQI
jgi:hypothetical protein